MTWTSSVTLLETLRSTVLKSENCLVHSVNLPTEATKESLLIIFIVINTNFRLFIPIAVSALVEVVTVVSASVSPVVVSATRAADHPSGQQEEQPQRWAHPAHHFN